MHIIGGATAEHHSHHVKSHREPAHANGRPIIAVAVANIVDNPVGENVQDRPTLALMAADVQEMTDGSADCIAFIAKSGP